ncbi:hypothetical protein [Chromobacterium violaceum]|uniref:hypothetical protein n=1 Tax=Chromobacterium violaceum TaxID=536 RepID=UPI002E764E85|nr:hypothetical protein [Chromobacterium violaceum]
MWCKQGLWVVLCLSAYTNALAGEGSAPLRNASGMNERVICSISAAVEYGVPVNAMLAVAEQEGGHPKQWVRNTNGTYDVGSMQFNTSYLGGLSRYGIRVEDVASEGCYPYRLAAWRIRGHIMNDHGDVWTRIANYHSKTPKFNMSYRVGLQRRARKWDVWLSSRFPTAMW